ncbi:pilus assembly protein N-terminal domain-containing protein [Myxococcus sp. 1LA]
MPGLERVAVGDPALIEVEVARSDELRLTGQAEGTTDLITWSRDGTMKSHPLTVIAR